MIQFDLNYWPNTFYTSTKLYVHSLYKSESTIQNLLVFKNNWLWNLIAYADYKVWHVSVSFILIKVNSMSPCKCF